MEQRDQEAWLQDLAARVDDGQPVDWEAAERWADGDGRRVVRALRIVAEIAYRGRRPDGAGLQSDAVPETDPQKPPAPLTETPVSDRFRSAEPSTPEEIRRKLLFGLALLLAFSSVLTGLLLQIRALQIGLAVMALVAVVLGLVAGVRPPAPPGGPGARG